MLYFSTFFLRKSLLACIMLMSYIFFLYLQILIEFCAGGAVDAIMLGKPLKEC